MWWLSLIQRATAIFHVFSRIPYMKVCNWCNVKSIFFIELRTEMHRSFHANRYVFIVPKIENFSSGFGYCFREYSLYCTYNFFFNNKNSLSATHFVCVYMRVLRWVRSALNIIVQLLLHTQIEFSDHDFTCDEQKTLLLL